MSVTRCPVSELRHAHGLDTVSIGWKVGGLPGSVMNGHLVTPQGEVLARAKPGPAGSLLFTPTAGGKWDGGATLGYFSQHGLAFMEGRAAAVISGDESNHDLAPPAAMPEVETVGAALFSRMGVTTAGERVHTRRLDMATELHFDEGADGLAFLDALGRLDVPRMKVDTWRTKGRTETVYLRTLGRGAVRARAYDKGVESKSHLPGQRVRLERQERWSSGRGVPPDRIPGANLGDLFSRPLAQFVEAAPMQVAGLEAATFLIMQKADAGEISKRAAERIIGTIAIIGRVGFDSGWFSRPTMYRRQAEMRALGIAIDPALRRRRVVPVGDLLARMVSAWQLDDLASSA